MVILTVGNSPYLLNREGKINKELLKTLKSSGHRVGGLVWNHDVKHFLPQDSNTHLFIDDAESVCKLFPYLGLKGGLPTFTLDVLKSAQPNVVVTISDYSDVTFLSGIKSRYRSLFKWVAIVPFGGQTINERYKYDLEMADAVIVFNKQSQKALQGLRHPKVYYIPFGPEAIFQANSEKSKFNPLYVCKLDQSSNISAYLHALNATNSAGSIHCNINDGFNPDVRLLLERYNLTKKVNLPAKFVSTREGLSVEEMNQVYNDHSAIVDCSMQSYTGLSLLEGMATGCVPLGVNFGAVRDILSQLPQDFRFPVSFEIINGQNEEEFAIASRESLTEQMLKLKIKSSDKVWLKEASEACRKVSSNFSKDNFSKQVKQIIENVVYTEHAVVVDSF